MVFDSQLTKIYRDHKKLDPTFTFSQRHWEKVKAGKKWVLNFNPSGVSVLSHFPSPPSSSNPSLLKIILQFPLEQGRLLPTGIAPWRSRPRGCCSWMVTGKWKTTVSNKSVSVRPGLLTCRSSYRPSRGSLPRCARESRRERSKGNDSGFKNYYLPTRRQGFWWSQAVFLGGWREVSKFCGGQK